MKNYPSFRPLAYLAALASLHAQSSPNSEVVQLPAFSVSATQPNEYHAVDTSSASRIRSSIMDTAASISVLTPEFIQDVEPARLYAATNYVSGISEGRGDGFADRQIIRGFENLNRTVDNFASIQGENSDSLLIDRVEVIKGPSAIIAPTGAPGGVVSIVSKAPLYHQANSVTLTLGAIDAQRVDLDMTGPFADKSAFAYRFLAGYQDGRLASSGTKDRRKVIGGAVSYELSPTTKLTVRGSWEDRWVFVYLPVFIDNSSVNGADAVLAQGFQYGDNRNGTETWAHRGGYYSTGDILFTTSFGDHISSRVAFKAQSNVERDRYMAAATPSLNNRYNPYTGQETPNATWAYNSATGTYVSTASPLFDITNIQRQPYLPEGHTTDYAAQWDMAAAYQFHGVSSTTVLGAAFDHQNAHTTQWTGANLPFNLLAPVYGAQPAFTILQTSTGALSRTVQYYVNEQVGFFKDRLLLTGGGVAIDAHQWNQNDISGVHTLLDASQNVALFGGVFKITKEFAVYVSRSSNAVPTITNNKALWQEGKQWEWGAKASLLNDRISLTASHFQISQTNVTVPNPAYQSDITQPQSLISDLTNHGWEVEVAGGITTNLSIVGSFSRLYETDSLNRPVRAISPRNAAALLNYKFAGDLKGLSVFVGTTYMGRRSGEAPAVNFTALGVVTQPSFFLGAVQLWNAGARYTWKRTTFGLNVDNLCNKKYIGIPTARTNAGLGLPVNPRLTIIQQF